MLLLYLEFTDNLNLEFRWSRRTRKLRTDIPRAIHICTQFLAYVCEQDKQRSTAAEDSDGDIVFHGHGHGGGSSGGPHGCVLRLGVVDQHGRPGSRVFEHD